MDVSTDGDATQQRNYMECERISHGICNAARMSPSGSRKMTSLPMYSSGINFDIASQAKYIEPRLCPKRVKRGQVESSTMCREFRKTKWSKAGSSAMSNRACETGISRITRIRGVMSSPSLFQWSPPWWHRCRRCKLRWRRPDLCAASQILQSIGHVHRLPLHYFILDVESNMKVSSGPYQTYQYGWKKPTRCFCLSRLWPSTLRMSFRLETFADRSLEPYARIRIIERSGRMIRGGISNNMTISAVRRMWLSHGYRWQALHSPWCYLHNLKPSVRVPEASPHRSSICIRYRRSVLIVLLIMIVAKIWPLIIVPVNMSSMRNQTIIISSAKPTFADP